MSKVDKAEAKKAAKLLKETEDEVRKWEKEYKLRLYNAQSGQYLVMAAEPDGSDLTQVSWQQAGIPRSATYYCMPCWFGSQSEQSPDTGSIVGIKPLDETFIFVASEYIEKRYQEVSVVKDKHLQNIKLNKDKEQLILRINEHFHYGQFKIYKMNKVYFRWLVYHPPVISRKGDRMMFQHRFIENNYQKFSKFFLKGMKGAADMMEDAVPLLSKAGALTQTAGSTIIDLVSTKYGDFLHKYDAPPKDSNSAPIAPAAVEVAVDAAEVEQQRALDEGIGAYVALAAAGTANRVEQCTQTMLEQAGNHGSEEVAIIDCIIKAANIDAALNEPAGNLVFSTPDPQRKSFSVKTRNNLPSRRDPGAGGMPALINEKKKLGS